MNSISVPVPPHMARAFGTADAEKKKQVEIDISACIGKLFGHNAADEQLFAIIKKASSEAKDNGLTTDKLNELVK